MNVMDFSEFYATARGQTAASLLKRQLNGLTRAAPSQTTMGLGYTLPFLDQEQKGALSLSFMLARQGVIHWPDGKANRSALVDEVDLPLLESMVDVALVIHGLEHADTPLEMLQEVWRVLAPQGRLILVVPNRSSLWAASETTPFGHGQPFSKGQIGNLLKDSKFTVTRWRSALYMPPLSNQTLLKAATSFDMIGERIASRFAGVIIVEAMKQVYAFSSGKRAKRPLQRFRPVLLPAPQQMRKD